MSDNDPDDRFSMPPIEGVWEGAGVAEPPEAEPEETPAARGLTLPPPGLFARLEEPSATEVEPVDDIDDVEAVEIRDDLEDHTAVVPVVEHDDVEPVAWNSEPTAAPASGGLAGVADAADLIEQLAAQIEAEQAAPATPVGDELVYLEAAGAIASTEAPEAESAVVVPEAAEPEPLPLPSYAAVPAEEPTTAKSLPMYGDGERGSEEEEILPHFLLEESAPLDIVAAQDELREMAHKNRAKATDDESRPSLARTLAEIPVLLIVAAVIAFLVKTFLAQAYYIPSGSMIPQLQIDDRVVVSKLAYKFHDPRRGDIIVFDDPRTGGTTTAEETNVLRKIGEGVGVVQPSTDEFIKRVIGLPGETVSGKDGYVYINGHKLIEPYLPNGVATDDFAPQTVAQGKLWVMGDNRSGSADSRVFGQIKISTIVGRAVVKVWPFSHISFL